MARKRRTTIEVAPLSAWHMAFSAGHDYLADLADFGLTDEDQIHAAARQAWAEHRAAFMATWTPTAARPLPWAEVAFPPD